MALSINPRYQKFKACGDKLFWLEMAEMGRVVHINKTLNYFRQHENKVSPRRFRDGTSLHEEYQIYQYQCSKDYLSGLLRIVVLSLYYQKIKKGDFESEQIREDLLHLWKFDQKIRLLFINLIARLYIYYRLYVLHKSVL